MVRPLRVLYVFPEPFPNDFARGVQVANSVCALAHQGAQIDFYYVAGGEEDPFCAYGLKKPPNVTLSAGSRRLPGALGLLPFQSNRLFSHGLIAWLRERLQDGTAPDVIYVRHIKVAAAIVQARIPLPVVYEAHEVFARTAKPSQRHRIESLERQVMEGAAAIVANSSATAQRLKAHYGLSRTIFVVPNGVADPVIAARKWDHPERSIVYAGSFYQWKGVEDLVRAANLLPGYRITCIGGSDEQTSAMRGLLKPGGADVVFTGRLPHQQVLAKLAESCIAVLPNRMAPDSDYTCPLKLFEYMIAGCAVVATKIPAVADLVGEHVVLWAAPNDPQSLAQGIRYLAENPLLARDMGSRAVHQARDFTWDARAEKILEIASGVARTEMPGVVAGG